MLGFFRRYQKSFMLIFLTPALLAMGITGAILSVVQNQGAGAAIGRIGDTKWGPAEFDAARRLYKVITNPRGEDEDAWRFLALLDAAQRAGLQVSGDEFSDYLRTNTRMLIARQAAVKNVQKRGIKITDPKFNKEWQSEFYALISKNLGKDDPDADFDLGSYKKAIQGEYGIDHREFEVHMRRQALVAKFLDTVRELAVVDPADIREAYQEKNHLRILDLVEVPASRYAPKRDANKGDPGYVTEDQTLAYYQRRELDFDEPRRVDMQYLALRFEDVADGLKIPGDETLRAFNAKAEIAPVGSFTEQRELIVDAWTSHESRRVAQDLMDRIADALDVAEQAEAKKPEKDRKGLDLVEIAKGVKGDCVDRLEKGSTGLVAEGDLTKGRDFLAGFAAQRWFRIKKAGETSDVMGSVGALFVLSTREVKLARTPRYEDIKAKVLTSYIEGTPKEQREHYEAHRTTTYGKDRSWDVGLAYYKDAWFDGDHAKTKEALLKAKATAEKLMAGGKGGWKKKTKASMDMFGREPSIQPALEVPNTIKKITEKGIAEHALLKSAKDGIPLAFPWRLTVFEVEGGWGLYRVQRTNPPEPRPFDDAEVQKMVRENIGLSRGLERAEDAVEDDLLSKLRYKTGDALAAALKELDLEVRTTKPFNREAVSLEGIEDAGRLVSEAFSAEIGGDFASYVSDPTGNRLILLRVSGRQDAPAAGYAKAYSELREAELSKARTEYGQERIREVFLAAKRITKEHMVYATSLREGPGNITGLKLRQIFLPPDAKITGDWLDKEAKGIAEGYLAELKKGTPWANMVGRRSEHTATARRGGELPLSTKEDLADTFGNDFAEAVWPLAKGDDPVLVKSVLGYHLVVMANEKEGRKVFKHLMVSLDPKTRKLPEAITQKAEAKSQEALNKALAALQAGQAFGKVASEFGDADDINGQGREFEIDFVTEFERVVLSEPLEWEQPEGSEEEDFVPAPVEIKGADGKTYWHLFACSRDPSDQAAAWDSTPRRDRQVFHIRTSAKAKAEAARMAMVEYIREQIRSEEGRPTWRDMVKRFQKIVPDFSNAPDAAKGGAVGMIRLEEAVRGYGDEFLKRVCFKADGTPVATGDRIGVFRGEKGFHLVEVVEVKTSKQDDSQRKVKIAELVLAGTGWQ